MRTEGFNMPVPIRDFRLENRRCINDLLRNAHSKQYCNERGFRQKLIDLLYRLGYYESNESIFESPSDSINKK